MADDQPPVSSHNPTNAVPAEHSAAGMVAPVAADPGSPKPASMAEPSAHALPESPDPIVQSDTSSPGNADIDALLKQANFEDPGAVTTIPAAPEAGPFDLPSFQQVLADAQVSSIDLLRDVELNVKIELGRSKMLVEDVLKLGEGSVVELDKLAGDPVDVFVNDRLVARGEVLVLNDNFCVRVNEIVASIREEGP